MENSLRPAYQEYINDSNTLGILIMEKSKLRYPLTDNFEVIILIVVSESEQPWQVKHYEIDERTTALNVATRTC